MNALLISSHTQQQIDSIIASQPQSLLVVGQKGSGRSSIALHIAALLAGIDDSKIHDYPYVTVVQPDGASVKIEQVQQIKKLLNLRTPETGKQLRRFIIIEAAHTMTLEAQNAALKFVEEPPADTLIMLLVENERDVLETIRSRCKSLVVSNPSEHEATTYASKVLQSDKTVAGQQYKLSGGRAGLFLALLEHKDHPLVRAMERAKSLLGAQKFERLIQVDELTKDKELSKNILFALDRIAHVGLLGSKANVSQSKRWHGVLQTIEQAEDQLSRNVNAKLVFTNLMLSL